MSIKALSLAAVLLLAACNLNTSNVPSAATEPVAIPTLTLPPTQPPTASPTPRSSPTAQTAVNSACPETPSNWSPYVVRPGDTLSRIASEHSTTTTELSRANCLERPDAINVGQTLYVPSPGLQVVEAGIAAATSTAEQNTTRIATAPNQPIQYYLALANDNGQSGIAYGCGDSMVALTGQQRTTGDLAADVRAALSELLAVSGATFEGYENALYNTELTIDEISVNEDTVRIDLSGTVRSVGACWDARMVGHLAYTTFQFPQINNALIRVDGRNLKQLLDASGSVRSTEPYRRSEFPN